MKHQRTHSSIVDEIQAFNHGREPKLVRLKYHRMAKGAFPFFRGTDHLFATRWHAVQPPEVGPAILICGDLHLENFGAYRTEDGDFLYDINDFDEALVAPCSLDLVRCTTSILLAAQLWELTPVHAMRMVLTYLKRYRAAVRGSVNNGRVPEVTLGSARGPIWKLLDRPAHGRQGKFIAHVTESSSNGPCRIRREPARFRTAGDEIRGAIWSALENNDSHPNGRRAVEVLDVVQRIAGIGSLGLPRYAALVREHSSGRHHRLLDIKAEAPPSLIGCHGSNLPNEGHSDAQRAVEAQRQLQAEPILGLSVLHVAGNEYRLRELIPEENRTSLDAFRKRPRRLRRAVAVAGRLTGYAHVRGSRVGGEDLSQDLKDWATGAALYGVISSAIRFAERTRRDHKTFCDAIKAAGSIRALVNE